MYRHILLTRGLNGIFNIKKNWEFYVTFLGVFMFFFADWLALVLFIFLLVGLMFNVLGITTC